MVPEVTGALAVPTAVALVERVSDKVALEALALRRGRDLTGKGVAVVAMGGAMSIGGFLDRFGPRGLALRVGGLCDESEEGFFRRGLERAGFGAGLTRAEMETVGFESFRSSPRSSIEAPSSSFVVSWVLVPGARVTTPGSWPTPWILPMC